jgi:hypothetical protein
MWWGRLIKVAGKITAGKISAKLDHKTKGLQHRANFLTEDLLNQDRSLNLAGGSLPG